MSFTFQLWEDKEGKKKMNKNNAKALSTLRQKIRKYNRDYETEIAAYKEVNESVFSVFLFLDVLKIICERHRQHP